LFSAVHHLGNANGEIDVYSIRILQNINMFIFDNKVMYFFTSSYNREYQVVGSCISPRNIKNFAYGDALYMSHYHYSSGGVSLHFYHFLYFIESGFNFLTAPTPVCILESCFIILSPSNKILLEFIAYRLT